MQRRCSLAVAAVLLLGAASPQRLPSDHQDASWSPDGRSIAFSTAVDGNYDVYVARSDGSELQRLTTGASQEVWTSWLPAGRAILFTSNESGHNHIYRLELGRGAVPTRVSGEEPNEEVPDLSPDGKLLAFVSNRAGPEHIFVMRADGSHVRQLTAGEYKQFNPRWSPNGRLVAYFEEKGDERDQLWVMNADGSGKHRVTDGSGHNVFPTWSRNGKSLLFISKRDDSGYYPYSIGIAGSALRRLGPERAAYVAQSRTGSLLFIRPVKGGSFLTVTRADGSKARVVH